MKSLQDQVAIVTGASRGIGKAIAHALAENGASVVLASRTARDVEAAATELVSAGHSAIAVPADVGNATDVERLVSKTVESYGRVDVLVNNAGVGVFKPVVDMDVSEFDRMWNVNMRGSFLCTKAVLPYMVKENSGHIVNISSLAGKNSVKNGAGYAATKWALRGFASSLMLEVREANIRVITIFPGSVDTAFSSTNKPARQITQPEDVAAAVVFAVSANTRAMFSEIDVRPTNPK